MMSVKISYKPQGDYGVFATSEIPKDTLLCEYSGNVEYARNVKLDCNTLLTLIQTKNSNYDQVIFPEVVGNIGQIINCSDNSREETLKSVKLCYN